MDQLKGADDAYQNARNNPRPSLEQSQDNEPPRSNRFPSRPTTHLRYHASSVPVAPVMTYMAISAEGDQISLCVVTQQASRANVVDLEMIGTAAVPHRQPSLAHCCGYWSSGKPRARKSSSECIQPSLPSMRTFSHNSVSAATPKPPASSMSPLELAEGPAALPSTHRVATLAVSSATLESFFTTIFTGWPDCSSGLAQSRTKVMPSV